MLFVVAITFEEKNDMTAESAEVEDATKQETNGTGEQYSFIDNGKSMLGI